MDATWQYLPADILECIFLNISDYYTHLSMMKTCKKLHFLAQQNQFELLKKFTIRKIFKDEYIYIQENLLPNSIRHGYCSWKYSHTSPRADYVSKIYNYGFKMLIYYLHAFKDTTFIYYKNIQSSSELTLHKNHFNPGELIYYKNNNIPEYSYENFYLFDELHIRNLKIIYKWYDATNYTYKLILRMKNNCVDQIQWKLPYFESNH
jgi:hypothetical protein